LWRFKYCDFKILWMNSKVSVESFEESANEQFPGCFTPALKHTDFEYCILMGAIIRVDEIFLLHREKTMKPFVFRQTQILNHTMMQNIGNLLSAVRQ